MINLIPRGLPLFQSHIKNNNTNSVYRVGILILSFVYALVLANYIPMDDSIKDRLNYLAYASSSDVVFLRYLSTGYLSVFSNEPVWLSINIFLDLFFEPHITLKFIIFYAAFVTCFLILSVDSRYFIFLLFLLFFPQVIDKFVVHIRQGLAISVFLLGWFAISKPWRWFLFALTPLIHASFFFVLFLYSFTWFLQQLRFALDLRTIATVLLGLMIGLGLSYIASLLGARQAGVYELSTTEASGLGFLFWLSMFVLYWLQGRKFAYDNALAMSAIAFYLATYFLTEFTARIFESLVIIVFLSSLDLSSWRRKVFILAVIAFFVLSWLSRINQPWLGWGVVY